MVAISRRSTLIAASISLALVSISPAVDAAAISARSSSSPAKTLHRASSTLPLPIEHASKKSASKKMEKKRKHKPRDVGAEFSPPASRFFQQAYFSAHRRDHDETVINGDDEHVHIHDKDRGREKIIVNGQDDHVHVERRHRHDEVVVNGDHDRVHVYRRGSHRRSRLNSKYRRHHDHDRADVIVNGKDDDVHVHRRAMITITDLDGHPFMVSRAPHHDHWDHDHWDHENVVVNGNNDKVDVHRRDFDASLGNVEVMANGLKVGELLVRNDSTIGAAPQGSACQLVAVNSDALSRRQTSDSDSSLVQIMFPAVLSDNTRRNEQVETCAAYNPDSSANGGMSVQPCNIVGSPSMSQLFQLFSDGSIRPAGSASSNDSASTNSSASGLDQRDTASFTPVTLVFRGSEATIQQFDDTANTTSTSTLMTTSTVTETATVTVTTSESASSPTDASDPAETLNVAIVGGAPDPSPTTSTSVASSPTSNAQAVASSIANASTSTPAAPSTTSPATTAAPTSSSS